MWGSDGTGSSNSTAWGKSTGWDFTASVKIGCGTNIDSSTR
jgi:hypothetical protein